VVGVRIHALHTPSHARLADEHFRPTAEKFFGAANVTCELVPGSPEGAYGSPGFNQYCLGKMRRYAELCEEAGGTLVLSDVDVRFYGDVPTDLQANVRSYDHEAYLQWDGPAGHCTGFIYVVRRAPLARLFRQVLEVMLAHPELEDQQALKRLVTGGSACASLGVLPTWKYWTAGLRGRHWSPGDPLSPPETILVHHGNWTVGVPNKLELLSEVARLVGAGGPT
jgi:hypothetical protein